MAIVAKNGDVNATPGSTPFPPATAGNWVAGAVAYKSYPKLKIAGVEAVYEAECTFTFTGTAPPQAVAATTGKQSTVRLTATTTKLQNGIDNVLKHGDAKSDAYGNKLEVVANGGANKNVSTS